jgi:tight adherence protein C
VDRRAPDLEAARVTPAAVGAGLAVALGTVAVAGLIGARGRRRRRRRGLVLGLLTRVGRRLGVAPAPEDLARRLAAAGAPTALRPGDVMAAKTGSALAALLAVAGPATALPGRLGPVAFAVVPLTAAHVPDLWLRRRARARGRVMAAEVADVLDLLRVCVEAGRPPGSALAEVGRRHRGLLGRELRRAARELELGDRRSDVFDALAMRCPVEEMTALVAAFQRADRHGSPLAPALVALAADARAARARAVRERAAKAAPKIQLVIALLLVPAVMLLVGAALASAFGAG